MKWGRIALVAVVGIVLPVALGGALVHTGVLFGTEPVRYGRALVVTAGLCVAALTLRGHVKGAGVDTLAAVVAIATGLYGLTGIVMPTTPDGVPTATCAGRPTQGADYLAVVQPPGLTARAGATTAANQVGELAAGCTVGLDGFCPGRAIGDISLDKARKDSRWFRVNTLDGAAGRLAKVLSNAVPGPEFVAGGRLATQVSTDTVKLLPDKYCLLHNGIERPGPARASFKLRHGEVVAKMEADRTFDFGFALFIQHGSRIGTPFVQLHTTTQWMSAEAAWTGETLNGSLSQPTIVEVLAVRCWGTGAPVEDGATPPVGAFEVAMDGAIEKAVNPPVPSAAVVQSARDVACQQVDA